VRQVEEASVVPNRAMLRDDAFVLDRHLIARERDHLRAELGVPVEERRAAHRRRLG